jgi:hypothetical protein
VCDVGDLMLTRYFLALTARFGAFLLVYGVWDSTRVVPHIVDSVPSYFLLAMAAFLLTVASAAIAEKP